MVNTCKVASSSDELAKVIAPEIRLSDKGGHQGLHFYGNFTRTCPECVVLLPTVVVKCDKENLIYSYILGKYTSEGPCPCLFASLFS